MLFAFNFTISVSNCQKQHLFSISRAVRKKGLSPYVSSMKKEIDLKANSDDVNMSSDTAVHVEVCQRSKSGRKKSFLADAVRSAVECGADLRTLLDGDLFEEVESIKFGGVNGDVSNTPPANSENRYVNQHPR